MHRAGGATAGRIRRLAEELHEIGSPLSGDDRRDRILLEEVAYALHPAIHERRVPSYGSFVVPGVPAADWQAPTGLTAVTRPVGEYALGGARLFADGLSSWLTRTISGEDTSVVFDRPAGSERDLVVLAAASGATVVQRHPTGVVRIVGDRGVWRHNGFDWFHEPPVAGWITGVSGCEPPEERNVLAQLLEFAVHDLGARGIGAILIHRSAGTSGVDTEQRLPPPPTLQITRPADLAPLTHALAQIDGACVFDVDGTLREMGVRLVPSPTAEASVDGLGGMRHTAGRRYSYDDAGATVIVISEDGPVTVLRGGEIIARTEVASSHGAAGDQGTSGP